MSEPLPTAESERGVGMSERYAVEECLHGETGVRDFHVTEINGRQQMGEYATRIEAEVSARVWEVREAARRFLWERGSAPLGDLLEHLKPLERDDALISQALSSSLSENVIALDSDRVARLVRA